MRAMRVAQDRGVNLFGVLLWTLTPNGEWKHGYDPKYCFGILKRDLETGQIVETEGFRFLTEVFRRSVPAQVVEQVS